MNERVKQCALRASEEWGVMVSEHYMGYTVRGRFFWEEVGGWNEKEEGRYIGRIERWQ